MKICPQCGRANDHAFVRCACCGASLDGVAAVNMASAPTNVSKNTKGNAPVNVPTGAPAATNTKNGVAEAVKAIAILVYIAGALMGVVLADYAPAGLLIGLLTGFFSGTMLLGFSEIIRLLHEINQKTR